MPLSPEQLTIFRDWLDHPVTRSLKSYLKVEIETAVARAVSARIAQPNLVAANLERVDVIQRLTQELDTGSFITTKPTDAHGH